MTARHISSFSSCFPVAAMVIALAATGCGPRGEEQAPLAKKTEKIETVEKKSVEAMTFSIVGEGSKVTFAMEAPLETQDGAVPPAATSGTLQVDLEDLTQSTALIDVDISELEIYQRKADGAGEYGERVKSDLQNEHMRDWLEIGEDAPPDAREHNRTVQFELDEIENASVTDISAMEGDTREVTFTGIGDFRLHQRSSRKKVQLAATFTYADGVPTQVTVKTVAPVVVDLAEHDVRPRTGFGQLAEKTLSAMSTKVGKEAQVSVAFVAKAADTVAALAAAH